MGIDAGLVDWFWFRARVLTDHLRRFKEAVCEAAGCDVERVVSFNRSGFLPWLVSGRILRKTRFGKLQLKIYDSFVWLWRILDQIVPLPGLSIIAIAKRPRA